MATRFEIVLHGGPAPSLRAAGEEALDEIDRLEAMLSLYRPGSEVARLNREGHRQPVRVTPELFRLLDRARRLTAETGGAFDITIAPLVRCWGFMGGTGALPETADVVAARELVGMHLVELNPESFTVRFAREGVMLDLGAIGKGYAVDRAAEILREAGVTSALIHGGTSTTYAVGRQADGSPWKVAITRPDTDSNPAPLAVAELEDTSLSVSAVWGRAFRDGARRYGHVLDPRTGRPAEGALMTALVLPSATESDALTTALLTAPALHAGLREQHPGLRSLLVTGPESEPRCEIHGLRPPESL